MTLNYLRIVGPFVNYAINYDYIVSELCVEKDEVENDCCGSCVVTKNLEEVIQDEKNDESSAGKNEQRSIKELMPHFILFVQIPLDYFQSTDYNFLSSDEITLKRESKPDIPPPKS